MCVEFKKCLDNIMHSGHVAVSLVSTWTQVVHSAPAPCSLSEVIILLIMLMHATFLLHFVLGFSCRILIWLSILFGTLFYASSTQCTTATGSGSPYSKTRHLTAYECFFSFHLLLQMMWKKGRASQSRPNHKWRDEVGNW